MSLMSILSNEPPKRGPKDTVSNPIYRLTEKYKAEIGEAREKGYSWSQIINAMRQDAGVGEEMRLCKVEGLYNAMRKKEGKA
ncbi:hypothetical protein FACS1894187_05230 [Synergistales bacterium]|nr:hypothetical protein FACS1894187_05230 [Synergistales bacterium]